MNVLVVIGHPRGLRSLCGALAGAFADGARRRGLTVEVLDLSTLEFDASVHQPSPNQQPLEPDLEAARRRIEWAEHLVFVYPTWWGTYPALLKGFLDRVLLPGWAFSEIEGGTGYVGHLQPRTAELVTTMDTPGPVYSLMTRAPGRNAMSRATLGFCGIDVVRHTRFGTVRHADHAMRQRWLSHAHTLGARLGGGPHTAGQRAWRRFAPWLRALRLQFYPMTFIAYWLGAVLAPGAVQWLPFGLGYASLFALEAATVFINDLFDEPSDRNNALFGPFSGGSRVLQDGQLTRPDLRRGSAVALAVSAVLFALLVATAGVSASLAVAYGVLALLAIGYTAPPLKLSWRGLGEIDVALTHSIMVILAGLTAQGGRPATPEVWLLGVPLLLSILPAIILSGVPDRAADAAAGKRTIAVRLGIPAAFRLSGALSVAAALGALVVGYALLPRAYGLAVPVLITVHALWIARRLSREAERSTDSRRIDADMAVSLSFVLWFCAVPLICWSG